jgi:hypothetical protein
MKRLRNSQSVTGLFVGLLVIGAVVSTCNADLSGWVAFQSNQDGDCDIWAVRSDGTGLRRLTDMAGEVWGPQ